MSKTSEKTSFFPHFTKTLENPAIQKLKEKYGMEGIGCYWSILEVLSQETQNNYSVENERGGDICDENQIKFEIFRDLFVVGLLSTDGVRFYSESLRKNMELLKNEEI